MRSRPRAHRDSNTKAAGNRWSPWGLHGRPALHLRHPPPQERRCPAHSPGRHPAFVPRRTAGGVGCATPRWTSPCLSAGLMAGLLAPARTFTPIPRSCTSEERWRPFSISRCQVAHRHTAYASMRPVSLAARSPDMPGMRMSNTTPEIRLSPTMNSRTAWSPDLRQTGLYFLLSVRSSAVRLLRT